MVLPHQTISEQTVSIITHINCGAMMRFSVFICPRGQISVRHLIAAKGWQLVSNCPQEHFKPFTKVGIQTREGVGSEYRQAFPFLDFRGSEVLSILRTDPFHSRWSY